MTPAQRQIIQNCAALLTDTLDPRMDQAHKDKLIYSIAVILKNI